MVLVERLRRGYCPEVVQSFAFRAMLLLLLLVVSPLHNSPLRAQPFVNPAMLEGYPDAATRATFGRQIQVACPTGVDPCEIEVDIGYEAAELQLRVYDAATRSLIYRTSAYRTKGRKRAVWYKINKEGKRVSPGPYPFLVAIRPAGGDPSRVSVELWGRFIVSN